ncbi:T9SS type A sorting domain-containing protein [Winogradskyella aurantia]|uniref:Secretion system C-terminal sorting domain-containing protein n=1 Tax=Winogradskyella aurantia TaxID=1915063 RepID=A0A265UZI2_9FLAO|nr:T9SS type A sorting domain-containing protein [Winogradskyella aurantia]OZV70710.1 hypothetical protein CA834_00945 [Winogradskyella aurantia]
MKKTTLSYFLKWKNKNFLIFSFVSFFIIGNSQNIEDFEREELIFTQPLCILYEGPYIGQISVPRSQEMISKMERNGNQCSNIVINYGPGFTPDATAAFEFAKNIWENSIESSVQITVNATFSALDPGALGGAAATGSLTSNHPDALPNVFYPRALVEKIEGSETDPFGAITVDITAAFSNTANWYFGLDAQPPGGQFDFVSVVLHELGHGLGFFGGASVGGAGIGSIRTNNNPTIYDLFIENGSGNSITDTAIFPDPSISLGNQLISNNLFCNGPIAVGQLSGTLPRIWAPSVWTPGSSYSHWDENTFVPGDINSLMSPQIGPGEANHNPGPITLGFFEDMGWSICGGSLSVDDISLNNTLVSPNPFKSSITINLSNGLNDDYSVTIFDINGRRVLHSDLSAKNGAIILTDLTQLDSAFYFIRITNKTNGAQITKKIMKS